MKQLFFLFSIVFLFSSCGEDDGGLGRITFIGIMDGWVITSIDSDLSAKSSAAVAATSDEDIEMAGRTRAELEQEFQDFTDEETGVDDCDRDDILFFLDNGQMRIIPGAVDCSGGNEDTALMDFNDNFYTTDLEATVMTIRSADGVDLATYTIEELDGNNFRLRTTRSYSDLLVGRFSYDITYALESN